MEDSGPLVRRSAIPKVHYSEACVPKLVYKLAEARYISVTRVLNLPVILPGGNLPVIYQ